MKMDGGRASADCADRRTRRAISVSSSGRFRRCSRSSTMFSTRSNRSRPEMTSPLTRSGYGDEDRFPLIGDRGPQPSTPAERRAVSRPRGRRYRIALAAEAVAEEIVARHGHATVRDVAPASAGWRGPADVAVPSKSRESRRVRIGPRAPQHASLVYKGLGFFDADEIQERWLSSLSRETDLRSAGRSISAVSADPHVRDPVHKSASRRIGRGHHGTGGDAGGHSTAEDAGAVGGALRPRRSGWRSSMG